MMVWRRHHRRVLDNRLALGSAALVTRVKQEAKQARVSFIEWISLFTTSGGRSRSCSPQCEGAQHIVGEREPQQDGAGLLLASHQQPGKSHPARPGIGALN